MLDFIQSTVGLTVQLLTLGGALSAFLVGLAKKYRSSGRPPHQPWFLAAAFLSFVTASIFGVRLAFPKPTLAISAPLGTVEVVQPDPTSGSVRFAVSGSSNNVPVDACVYVLVRVDSEWHVQGCVEAQPDGEWALADAWIGDNSAPVAPGVVIHLMAVVARPGVEKDSKISHPYQLAPRAVSKQARAKVQNVQPLSRHASLR